MSQRPDKVQDSGWVKEGLFLSFWFLFSPFLYKPCVTDGFVNCQSLTGLDWLASETRSTCVFLSTGAAEVVDAVAETSFSWVLRI